MKIQCVKNCIAERSTCVGEGVKIDLECMETGEDKHHEHMMVQVTVNDEGA